MVAASVGEKLENWWDENYELGDWKMYYKLFSTKTCLKIQLEIVFSNKELYKKI